MKYQIMSSFFSKVTAALPDDLERIFAQLPDDRAYRAQDMLDVSARFANVLVSTGVKPGDRVAVQVEKSIEAVMLYLATLRAGAVFLPLNTAYTPAEIDYFLGDARPSLFICDPAKAEPLQAVADKAGARLETLGGWQANEMPTGTIADMGLEASTEFEDAIVGGDDLAAICYTSGTTGRSKGAMLTHDNLISNAQTLINTWGITPDDVLIHALPIYHVHGLFVALNTVLLSGASMIFQCGFVPGDVLDAMEGATMFMGVPTFYTRLLADDGLTKDKTANMRLFVSGSAPLLAETFDMFEQRTGLRILERYGMTETGMNTSNPLEGDRRAGTVGPALPGVETRIAGEDGTVLSTGDIGVLEVRGPNVFQGYWQMPEKTAEEFRDDGFFITGDLATIDGDGYVTIVGRNKDLIITGGLNVYPKEIEAVIDDMAGVGECAIVGVPHPDFGEGVVAVIAGGNGELTEAQVIEHAKTLLAGFKVPKHVFFIDALPRNTMGKVQKNVLREAHEALFSAS